MKSRQIFRVVNKKPGLSFEKPGLDHNLELLAEVTQQLRRQQVCHPRLRRHLVQPELLCETV